ncbi:alpha-mannosidase II [Galdieria sulphuraria]|uniref:alpha-mannosidase n=1 Tax=Galdieria sulphuraria TaxID=130081 RepID=M2XUL1_GALSU|nr:alpha-mannosidase II [Galdieria sulphuraria]EME27109.1 alpha-mannosidase II [Galdieria sulphuraria]|eukprot:XP_005703629.1 alpha-mannosidase II [Galdieria sulphuraria]
MAQHYKKESITLERLELFCGWKDFNTYGHVALGRRNQNLCGHLWKEESVDAIKDIQVYSCKERISFEQMKQLSCFRPANIGEQFGPSWSTHWFRVELEIPESMAGKEVHFLWDCNAEALLYSEQGISIQGLVGGKSLCRRADYRIAIKANGRERFTFFVEMAASGLFGVGQGGDIEPPDEHRYFLLEKVSVAVFDRDIWNLLCDLTLLAEAARLLYSPYKDQALRIANDIVNTCVVDDPSTWNDCRELAKEFFQQRNGDGQALIIACGHCHIDTAWLWPYEETIRKCARSWSTQIRNMEQYDGFHFVASQAQQMEWIKERYPELWKEIKAYVKRGRFVPVGGTWVEMDCNLPSGESLVRQFVFGDSFFQNNFGMHSSIFWLPDTFGYSSQLPQIMRLCNIKYFMTQKLSWNLFNRFPHSTFVWEGLDGSSVLTHFPPADTYNSLGNLTDVLRSVSNNKDIGSCNAALLLFGHGDGGGGPSPAMIESLSRMKDVAGIPQVEMNSPQKFFDIAQNYWHRYPRWKGELYFELHRGTYTSQANVKQGNRKCELLLKYTEGLCAVAYLLKKKPYPYEHLEKLWKLVLLNQFHDTLPGSSIQQVYQDAARHHEKVSKELKHLMEESFQQVIEKHHSKDVIKWSWISEEGHPWSSFQLIYTDILLDESIPFQTTLDGKHMYLLRKDFPMEDLNTFSWGFGIQSGQPVGWDNVPCVSIQRMEDKFILENAYLRCQLTTGGHLTSFQKKGIERDAIQSGAYGNRFVTYDDVPLFWDAWDIEVYHEEKYWEWQPAKSFKVLEKGPLRVVILFEYEYHQSYLWQYVMLDLLSDVLVFRHQCDWHESRKLLRVEFPTSVLQSMNASFETQFGWVSRPTHRNTSWDIAKFEVCGHRFADLSDPSFGVALLNDCKYGYSVKDNVIRMSLLRSPKSPDDHCDMGKHSFSWGLYVHEGAFPQVTVWSRAQALQQWEALEYPFHVLTPIQEWSFSSFSQTFMRIVSPYGNVLWTAMKKAEREENAICVRLYEAFGCPCNRNQSS